MWQQVFIAIIRVLIGDTDPSNQNFSDDRILQSSVVSALIVGQQYQFQQTTYTYDILNVSISPDPIINYDPVFIALVTLKAACLFLTESYRGLVGGIVQVQDGDSEVSTAAGASAYINIIKTGPCASYNELVDLLMRRKIRGRAVSSPFTSFNQEGNAPFGVGQWSVRGFFDGAFGFGLGGF